MKKRYLFGLIIIVFIIIKMILVNVLEYNLHPIVAFLLTIPFYIFIYVYYRESKLIVRFAFIAIFTTLAYEMFVHFSSIYPITSSKMRLLGSVSFFGSIINLMLAFGIILQTNKNHFVSIVLMALAINNFFFVSYYSDFLISLLASFFGPSQQDIDVMLVVYNIVYIVIQIIFAGLEVAVIFIFDRYQELNEKVLSH